MRRNCCRSVISLQEPLPHSWWISLDLHGILAMVWTPAYPVVSICVLATEAPCLQHHVIVSTAQKVNPTSLLPAQSVAVSASADRQPLSTLSRVSPSISIIPLPRKRPSRPQAAKRANYRPPPPIQSLSQYCIYSYESCRASS